MKNFKRFLVVALMGGILMTSSISLAGANGASGTIGGGTGGGKSKPRPETHQGSGRPMGNQGCRNPFAFNCKCDRCQ